MAAAAFYYLATAGAPEARELAWEATSNGEQWIAEVTRQACRLMGDDPARLYDQYKAAHTKVIGAFNRARGGVESVLTLSQDSGLAAGIKPLVAGLETARDANLKLLEAAYRDRCRALGVAPAPITLTEKEREYSLLVPHRLFEVYSAEAQRRSETGGGPGQAGGGRGRAPGLPGLSSSEISIAIDGKRSILDIYQLVRAECGNLVIGSNELKFAYVLSQDAPDVELEAVANAIRNLEKAGVVEIRRIE